MKMARKLFVTLWLLAPAWALAEPADMVLFNGHVITVDRAFSIQKALAIKDGKILAVGGDEIARKYEAPVRIDLKGRTLMPGFMDNHLHPRTVSPRSVDVSAGTARRGAAFFRTGR